MENIVNHKEAEKALKDTLKDNSSVRLTADQAEKFYQGWAACEAFHFAQSRKHLEDFHGVGRG